MDILSISAICIIAALLAKLIEPSFREIKLALSITAVVVILLSVADSIELLFDGIRGFTEDFGISQGLIAIAVKVIGIGYVCELSSNSLRDIGESALASIIDICGKISIAMLCLPVILNLIDTVVEILE